MRLLTLGFTEWGASIELRLLDTEEFQRAQHEHRQKADVKAFSRLLTQPARHEPDAQIFVTPEQWTWEVANHEMMHCALHIARLRRLPLDPTAEVLPTIAGEFSRYLQGPYEPKGAPRDPAN